MCIFSLNPSSCLARSSSRYRVSRESQHVAIKHVVGLEPRSRHGSYEKEYTVLPRCITSLQDASVHVANFNSDIRLLG